MLGDRYLGGRSRSAMALTLGARGARSRRSMPVPCTATYSARRSGFIVGWRDWPAWRPVRASPDMPRRPTSTNAVVGPVACGATGRAVDHGTTRASERPYVAQLELPEPVLRVVRERIDRRTWLSLGRVHSGGATAAQGAVDPQGPGARSDHTALQRGVGPAPGPPFVRYLRLDGALPS